MVVHTCRDHGILGSDTLTGDMTLTEVEVYGSGNQAAPSAFTLAESRDIFRAAVFL